ncbi:MAG: exodeoxyribonuclease III [Acidobacteriota bacterium]|jgi:exodeoxyribonuclease-3|nr:exodeoxyribonuclease III [Acidobacteriota bacterium]
MKVATWNVNGIRAREAQVLQWLAEEDPDVVCLQELKAAREQVPASLTALPDYWGCWHGERAYSGVALLLHRRLAADAPSFGHPGFDFETRVVTARVGEVTYASVYAPNGGKDFAAKIRFFEEMGRHLADLRAAGRDVVLCGDMNITRGDIDVHPKERKPDAIGQRPEERALFERVLSGGGLTDAGRALAPDDDRMFTWWPPWRGMRQKNIGWRLDYVLASGAAAARVKGCAVRAGVGTSDHAPVVAEL